MMKRPKKAPTAAEKRAKHAWNKALGARIQELRLAKGLSQSDLAYGIRIEAQNISRVERGLISPSAYLVAQIAGELEVSLSEFFEFFQKIDKQV